MLYYLIEAELRYIYIRFGYPFINKLYQLLINVGYKAERKAIETINKFYYFYQIKS